MSGVLSSAAEESIILCTETQPGDCEINETGELDLDLHDVCYFVSAGKETKHLLQNVDLHLAAGEMSALMGPSGAGKSTLLDLIADRKNVGTWTGKILVNRTPRSAHFNRISAYVLQDNCHIPSLTVEETLLYSAWTRLPQGSTRGGCETRVSQLLEMMGMTDKRGDTVGDLSGGFVKRLSIAVEIISLPYILFLDEPTSGLDSSTAFEVMSVVRGLSRRGRTCLTTIHQPSPEVFMLFDRLVLLCAGRVVYSGLVKDATSYFTSSPLLYPARPRQNPAEYIIDIAGGRILHEGATMPRSDLELESLFYISGLMSKPATMVSPDPLEFSFVRVGYAAKVNQVGMLLHRGFKSAVRDRTNLTYTLAKNIWLGMLIGLVFRGVAYHLEEPFYTLNFLQTSDTSEFTGLLYFLLVYIWLSNGQIIPQCVEASKLYWRELASFAYVPSAYWLAIIVVEIPFMLLFHTIFATLVYLLCGFANSASYYFFFWLVLGLANFFSMLFAQFLAFFTGSSLLAFAIYPVVFYVLGMFSSYTIRIDDLTEGFRWVCEVTFVRWAFEGLMILEFERYGDDGDAVLEDYGFENETKQYCAIVLFVNILVAAVLLYLSLRPPSRQIVYLNSDAGVRRESGVKNGIAALEQSLLEPSTDGGSLTATSASSTTLGVHVSGALSAASGLLASVAENLEIIQAVPRGYRDKSVGAEDRFLDNDISTLQQNRHAQKDNRGSRSNSMNARGTKMAISLHNVGLILPATTPRTANKTLLYNVNGCIQPKQMCAVMGPSGAGKTALLDIIFGNHTGKAAHQGDVLFNNTPRTPQTQRRLAYVPASDIHIPVFTVRETLMYAATLRMQFKIADDKKKMQVEEVLSMLGLTKSADTMVGNHLIRGISGGQKRRLSIGVEIIHYPDAIMIDECTTGLDSATSDEVVGSVRNLCNQDRTVILSIHQPSPITFKQFDTLLLLSEGRVCYFGPADKAVSFFTESPFKFVMPDDMNPGDFVVSIAGHSLVTSDGSKPATRALNIYYTHSQSDIDAIEAMDECEKHAPPEQFKFELFRVYPTPRWFQIYILLERYIKKTTRNTRPVIIGFLRHVLVGLLYGSIYFDMKDGLDPNFYDMRFSLSFFSVLFITLVQQQTIPAYFDDKVIFDAERKPRIYSIFPYWFSSWVVYLPQLIFNTWTFGTLVYTMAGYRAGAEYYGMYILVMLVTALYGFAICQLVASLSPTPQTAMSVFPVIVFSLMSVAGYFISLENLDDWLRSWAPRISPLRWSTQAIMLNELSGNDDLPLHATYLESYGYDHVTKYSSLLYATVYTIILFLGLVYAIRVRKVVRVVL